MHTTLVKYCVIEITTPVDCPRVSLVIIIIIIHFFVQVFSESTEAVATSIRKQVRGCLQNLYQSVAIPEVRTFGTLITSTKVFSLIIICKSL